MIIDTQRNAANPEKKKRMKTERLDRTLRWLKGPAILDVGCTSHNIELDSEYWLHGRIRQQYPEVTGIDFSRQNVEELQALGFSNLHVQSAEDFELGRRFDTIVAGELIEHLSRPGAFLAKAKQHLAPGGRIVVSTPNPFSLLYSMYAFLKFPNTCQNLQHACWLCPRTLTELAAREGLKVRHWELIEDYRFDDPSLAYRCFSRMMTIAAALHFPKRLTGSTMLFVLEA
jgi:2-polyprenyl-3-methyl-5-hydroxy-6-metoxy-1,4-benzoquinol methylase